MAKPEISKKAAEKLKFIKSYYKDHTGIEEFSEWEEHMLKEVEKELESFIDYEYQRLTKLVKQERRST